MLKNRHLGKFYVTLDAINSSPKTIRRLMSKLIVLDCSFKIADNRFEYTAMSKELFESCSAYSAIPNYDILIHKTGEITAKRC